MNIEAKSANHIEKSVLICYWQIANHDCLNISGINNINKDVLLLWQKRIYCNSQLPEEDINID